MEQLNLYDLLYEKYKITKPIRLIELFSGYGSQALALKYLGAEFTHWRICEWATKSIQAYNDLHIRDYKDYSKALTSDAIIERLATYGISMNYNEPMTLDQIKRKGEAWQRQTYNNIIATHNLVDVSKAKANDLNIIDTENFTYLLTYSFPCQDLSKGNRKAAGMSKNSNSRSGMLWHVERLLDELNELPQVLVMENVPDVLGQKNINDFQDWQLKLEKLGYNNFVKVFNAKDFKIPQNRQRCFMVSILGSYNYKMPKQSALKYLLDGFLETNVSSKYNLSDKMLKCLTDENTKGFNRAERFYQTLENTNIKGIESTVETRAGSRPTSNYIVKPICINSKVNGKQPSLTNRIYSDKGIMTACTTTTFFMGNVLTNGTVRKLTPKECFRLMGVKDIDFNNVAKNQTDNSLYHLAGDSIVTTVLMAIFGELLGIDYQSKITELVEELKECA